MQGVTDRIQIRNLVRHLFDRVFQLLLFHYFLVQFLLQVPTVLLELLLLLLLLVVELFDVGVHRFDLFLLSRNHFFMVLLDGVVVHHGVALVADTVQLDVLHRKLALRVAASLADSFAAAGAVLDCSADELLLEGSLAKLAKLLVLLLFD